MLDVCSVSHAKQATKIHCRYTPKWEKGKPTRRWLKRIYALLERHRWSDNPAINAMRKKGYSIKVPGRFSKTVQPPRSRKMRVELESVMKEAAFCMAYFANLDPFSPALFEVECSISGMARFIGIYHEYPPAYDDAEDGTPGQYRHGRVAYCRLLNCLTDMEQAGLIVVAREYDKDKAQYKASRIFLTPLFFKSIGMPLKQVGEYLSAEEKRLRKKGLAENFHKRTLKQERLLGSGRVASVERISLKNLLTKLRDQFFHESKIKAPSKNSDKFDSVSSRVKRLMPYKRSQDEVFDLSKRASILLADLNEPEIQFYKAFQLKHPELPNGCREFYQAIIDELRRRLSSH